MYDEYESYFCPIKDGACYDIEDNCCNECVLSKEFIKYLEEENEPIKRMGN